MVLRFVQSLGMWLTSSGARCTTLTHPVSDTANNAINSLFITAPMFDFAVVHCLALFHLGSERSVATVQLHRTAALSGQLYSERKCFHVVIIVELSFLVNSLMPNYRL